MAKTFKALGVPVRLEMIKRLSEGSLFTIGDLSSDLGLTRQGARKHLQVLANVDLVTLHTSGRNTTVELHTKNLIATKEFISQLEQKWEHRLIALKGFVENGSK